MNLLTGLGLLALAAGDGQAAFEAGRYEEAARLLTAELASSPSYDGYLFLGLAQGRLSALGAARTAFDRALQMDPRRSEAWVERGGLSFLEQDYLAAIHDLQQALRRAPDEAYARDLLATSLHLAGRGDEALGQWNRLGQPQLGQIGLQGLQRTRERLVRRELCVREGEWLRLSDLRRTRLRLNELGIFERTSLRPVPRGAGIADLQLAFVERPRFFASPVDFALSTGILALQGRARLRYTNVSGTGLSLAGEYRFQQNRPELSFSGELGRPFGLPVTARLRGFRGRQGFDIEGDQFTRRARGFELGARYVLSGGVVLDGALQARERTFSVARSDAPPGWLAGPALAAELRLVDRYRQRLDARAGVSASARALGADVGAWRADLRLVYKLQLSPPEGVQVEPSVLAVQVKVARLSSSAPIDEWLAPGGSPEMEWPLRARRVYQDGRLGASSPLARSLVLGNLEWRRRVYKGPALQVGLVAFYDAAWVARGGAPDSFHDVGLGVRLGLRAGPLLRLDYGHGLTDGQGALLIGLGYFF